MATPRYTSLARHTRGQCGRSRWLFAPEIGEILQPVERCWICSINLTPKAHVDTLLATWHQVNQPAMIAVTEYSLGAFIELADTCAASTVLLIDVMLTSDSNRWPSHEQIRPSP